MSEQGKPGPDFSGSGPVEYKPDETQPRSSIEQLLATEQSRLMAIPGVVSVGIGQGGPGGYAISVGVTDAGVAAHVPSEIGGFPVTITVTGEVEAQKLR